MSSPTTLPRYITVLLGGEAYGIAVPKIRDILRLQKLQPVSEGPAYLRGSLAVRRCIVPVVDLRLRFDQPATLDALTCILVVEIDLPGQIPFSVGLIVDTIHEVFCVGDCDPLVCSILPATADGIMGECRIKGRTRRLLDVDHVIPAETMPLLARLARPATT